MRHVKTFEPKKESRIIFPSGAARRKIDSSKINGKEKQIRQVIITDHGNVKMALIITKEFDLSVEKIFANTTAGGW